MSEMEPRPDENDAVDRLLRRSMAGPIPNLSPDFEGRFLRAVRRDSEPLNEYYRKLLTAYGVMSVVVSAALMRGQALAWGAVAASVIAPLVLVAAARSLGRAAHATTSRSG